MRVAIIHYWLLNMRGGEAVLDAIAELFPQADIYTHVLEKQSLSPRLQQMNIKTTFIARLPFAKRWYQKYLPLMPLALESLDLSNYDLVISSESGPAKGVIPPPGARHLCYCHTPMRYVWDMSHVYLSGMNRVARFFAALFLHYLRLWDRQSAGSVDLFLANSEYVRGRIWRYYRREAKVLPPPVAIDRFQIAAEPEDYFVFLGQLVAYKRADLAIEAFRQLGFKLKIIGDGELFKKLKAKAPANVEFLGKLPDEQVVEILGKARALVFPGLEDFGIVPLEAMACGRPVIAYGAGGILDTVVPGKTGLFFAEQTPAAVVAAVLEFNKQFTDFQPAAIRQHAEQFQRRRFLEGFKQAVNEVMIRTSGHT